MKKIICALIIISMLFTVGCFNYRDMNKLLFSISVIFDIDEKDNVILYSEFFKASRFGQEKMGSEDRILARGSGETILDAFYNTNTFTGGRVAYDVNKVLIYTENAAREGLDKFIDSPLRNQRPTLREYMFIYCGNPEELLNIEIKDEKFIGFYLDNAMTYQNKFYNIAHLRVDEYTNERLMGSRVSIIPIINKTQKSIDDRIAIEGAAVIVDDKMVDKMNLDEVTAYKFLTNDVKDGTIVTKKTNNKDGIIALDSLKNKTKKYLEYDGEIIKFNITINTIASVGEVIKGIILTNDSVREELEKNAEDTIRIQCEELLKRFKKEKIDILNIQRQFEMKHHGNKIEDIMDRIDFNVDVNVEIEGSQNTNDSK